MPRKAPADEQIDPVRSRLAAEVAAPPPPRTEPRREPKPQASGGMRESGGGVALAPPPVRHATGSQRMTVNKKFLVTADEGDRIDELLDIISARFGKAGYAHVSRAMWSILAGAEEALSAGPVRERLRPPSKGDYVGTAEFEQALADFLLKAIKRS